MINNRNAVFFIAFLLLFSASYILVAGKIKYENASKGIEFFGFNSTEQAITLAKENFSALEIIIDNKNDSRKDFFLTYYLNEQEIYSQAITLEKMEIKKISASYEIKKNLMDKKNSIKYSVKISWEENNEKKQTEIYKKINVE